MGLWSSLFGKKVTIQGQDENGKSFERELARHGFIVGQIVYRGVSGGTWRNSGKTIQSALPSALADNGDIYILYGGANDVLEASPPGILNPDVLDAIKNVVSSIITTVNPEAIIIVTQTPIQGDSTNGRNNPAHNAYGVPMLNTYFKNIPAYAENVSTGWQEKIFIADVYTALGNPMPDNYTKGGLDPTLDDIHPSAFQASRVGQIIGETIRNNVLK